LLNDADEGLTYSCRTRAARVAKWFRDRRHIWTTTYCSKTMRQSHSYYSNGNQQLSCPVSCGITIRLITYLGELCRISKWTTSSDNYRLPALSGSENWWS